MSFDNIAATCTVSSDDTQVVYKKNAASTILLYISEDNEEMYCSLENGKYYMYYENYNKWIKEETDNSEFEESFEVFNFPYGYSYFTYNSVTGIYEGSCDGGEWYVTFENNRVVKIALELKGVTTLIIEYSYDNINLTLPTVEGNANEAA